MKFITRLTFFLVSLNLFGNTPSAQAQERYIFKDEHQDIKARVADLINRMTLDEKVSQLYYKAKAIERLGIPAFCWWNQAMNGVDVLKPATLYPVPIALAATWDTTLVHSIANATSEEARVFYNIGAMGKKGMPQGLVYRAPVIDLSRHPLWGRIQECWGEDQYLTSSMGIAFVKGLQGNDPDHLKTAATLKHFIINNQETDRTKLKTIIDERSLMEYYAVPFRECIQQAHASSVMAAYNGVNGFPCAVNTTLLTDVLRNLWGFDGFVVSDTGGIDFLVGSHHYTTTMVEAVAAAIKAGCDMDDEPYAKYLADAVKKGLLKESDIDKALTRTLTVRFKLGDFDDTTIRKFTGIPIETVDSKKNRELALQSAKEAIVLLKNKDHVLPLMGSSLKNIAIIGPGSDMLVKGQNTASPGKAVKPLEGIRKLAGNKINVFYQKGCNILPASTDDSLIHEAVNTAKKADVVVVFAGTDGTIEFETRDRKTMNLPEGQQKLIREVYKANPKTIVVLMNAGPLAVKWEKENVPGILYAWWSGEEAGNAIAEVLFGRYNPSGKLPYTVYESADQVPAFNEYDVTKGFTYQYFKGTPLFSFGYGLSYTQFKYSDLKVEKSNDAFHVTFKLSNVGPTAGAEVAQLYIHLQNNEVKLPIKKLVRFSKIELKPDESQVVTFNLQNKDMQYYNVDKHNFVTGSGNVDVLVGGSSDNIVLRGAINIGLNN